MPDNHLLAATTQIVVAYAQRNYVSAEALPDLIVEVRKALAGCGEPAENQVSHVPVSIGSIQPHEPIVPVADSVGNEELTCLVCGGNFRTLRRHLRTAHGLSPSDYRLKYRLPVDYPMTAPAYSKVRQALARKVGLGLYAPDERPRQHTTGAAA